MAEAEKIVVVKKFGAVTGKEMFRVRGDNNGWCGSPHEAVTRHQTCKAWWDIYHKTGGKK